MILYMIKNPIKSHITDPFGKTQDMNIGLLNEAMITIIKSGNFTEILNFFLVNNKSTFVDKDNNTVFHLIIKLDNLTEEQKIYIMNELISDPYNLFFDSFNNFNETPLHIAIKKLYSKIVEFLLKKGSDANKINANQQNSLHIALLPNIQPCELKISPDPIIKYEDIYETKNESYNKILSVFYNNKDKIINSFNRIHDSLEKYEDYYKDYKESNKSLLNENIIILDTHVDIALKDLDNVIINNKLNPIRRNKDTDKLINDQVGKTIKDITYIYNQFSRIAINEIDIEKRDDNIFNSILNYNYPNIDEYINSLKKDVLFVIYDEIDMILKTLHKNYNNNRKDTNGYIDRLRTANDPPIGPLPLDNIMQSLENYDQFPNSIYIRGDNTLTYKQNIINNIIPPEQYQANRLLNSYKILGLDQDRCTNRTLKMFAYLYGSYLYSDHPENVRKEHIIKYYNMLVRGDINKDIVFLGYKNNTESLKLDKIIPNIVESNINLFSLDKNDKFELEAINSINKMIIKHIQNLNLWLSLDNMQIYNTYSNISETLIQPLEFIKNIKFNEKIYNTKDAIVLPSFLIQKNKYEAQEILLTNTTDLKFIPNSFNSLKINADYLDLLKRRYIKWFIEQNIIDKNLLLDKSDNINRELIIIKILDKIIIETIKTNNYLLAVKKVRNYILSNNFNKQEIIKALNFIITKTSYSQRLDKKIDEIIDFKPLDIYNIIDIIDIDIINKVFDSLEDDPTTIRKKNNNIEYDDQLVYYGKDYNNLEVSNVKKCLYNSTLMIDTILTNGKNIDYKKLDINGYTPLFYAIQVSNYILIREVIKKYSDYPIQIQINRYGISTIKYAYNIAKDIFKNKPDFDIINITYMNNLLLLGDINRNIPKDYNKLYKKILDEIYKNISINYKSIFTNEDMDIKIDRIETNIKNSLKLERSLFGNLHDELEQNINYLKQIIILLEGKYKNLILGKNKYADLLIILGKISIKDLFEYYKKVIRRILYLTNIYNYKNDKYDNLIKLKLNDILDKFLEDNLFDLVKDFYLIKKNQFDNLRKNQTPIEYFFIKLLDNLVLNGILEIDDNPYLIIKQQFNSHMIELVSKTLEYSRILLDINHRWLINHYHSIRTLYELIKNIK